MIISANMEKDDINRRVDSANTKGTSTTEATPSGHYGAAPHHNYTWMGGAGATTFSPSTGVPNTAGINPGISTAGHIPAGFQQGMGTPPVAGWHPGGHHTPQYMPAGAPGSVGPPWTPGYGQYNTWIPPFPTGYNVVSII